MLAAAAAGAPDAAAATAASDVGRLLLHGLPGPLGERDLCVIKDILRRAEASAVQDAHAGTAAGGHVNLARLLEAYDAVLPQHGLAPAEDTHYYRILLKLALGPNNDWWERFAQECSAWARCAACPRGLCPARMPRSRVCFVPGSPHSHDSCWHLASPSAVLTGAGAQAARPLTPCTPASTVRSWAQPRLRPSGAAAAGPLAAASAAAAAWAPGARRAPNRQQPQQRQRLCVQQLLLSMQWQQPCRPCWQAARGSSQ
jgi:hypothetical protein